jgi:hypothetical protein
MLENLNKSKKPVITKVCRPSNYGQDSLNKEPITKKMLNFIKTNINKKSCVSFEEISLLDKSIVNLRIWGQQ